MKLLVINPNSTSSMTAKIAVAANVVAMPDTKIIATNPDTGPASIQGYYDEAMCLGGVLQIISSHQEYDAVIVACFDDTGVDAIRCITDKPVVGIGEAAFHYASIISNKFSVITTLGRSVPAIEHNLNRYGLAVRCSKVRSSELAVLELEDQASNAVERISDAITQAIEHDRAEAIVLGCAGMTNLIEALRIKHDLPIIDGVACAVSLAESMVRLKLKTSELGGYAKAIVN